MQRFYLVIIFLSTLLFYSCKEEKEPLPTAPISEERVQLIKEMTLDGETDVSVYADFHLIFNNIEGNTFEIDGEQFLHNIREIEITDESGKIVEHGTTWNSNKDSLNISFFTKLEFSEKYAVSYVFEIEDVEGKRNNTIVNRSYSFTTQERPEYYDDFYLGIYRGSKSSCGGCQYNIYQSSHPNMQFSYAPNTKHQITENLQMMIEVDVVEYLIEGKPQKKGEGFGIYINKRNNKLFLYNPDGYLFDSGFHQMKVQIRLKEFYKGSVETVSEVENNFSYNIIENNNSSYVESSYPKQSSSNNKVNSTISFQYSNPSYQNSMFTKFKTELQGIEIMNDGKSISSELKQRPDDLLIIPAKEFIANSGVKLILNLKQIYSNDSITFSENISVDRSTITFQVGVGREDPIGPNFIKASYPVAKQLNYMIEEYDKGIVQLYETQENVAPYLSAEHDYLMIIESYQDSLTSVANYDAEKNQFTYEMPVGLEKSTVYSFSLYSQEFSKSLFSDYFQTSKYGNFEEKMSDLEYANTGWRYPTNDGYEFGYTIKPNEIMDAAEISSLVKYEGLLEETQWYTNHIKEVLYVNYSDLPFEITWRDTNKYGVPPTKAFSSRSYDLYKLPSNVYLRSAPYLIAPRASAFSCNSDIVMRRDFSELKEKAKNYKGEANEAVNLLLNNEYVGVNSNIAVNLAYTIPGYNVVSSRYRVEYNLSWLSNRESEQTVSREDLILK